MSERQRQWERDAQMTAREVVNSEAFKKVMESARWEYHSPKVDGGPLPTSSMPVPPSMLRGGGEEETPLVEEVGTYSRFALMMDVAEDMADHLPSLIFAERVARREAEATARWDEEDRIKAQENLHHDYLDLVEYHRAHSGNGGDHVKQDRAYRWALKFIPAYRHPHLRLWDGTCLACGKGWACEEFFRNQRDPAKHRINEQRIEHLELILNGFINPGTCPSCRHAFHDDTCYNMASDNDCSCTYRDPLPPF